MKTGTKVRVIDAQSPWCGSTGIVRDINVAMVLVEFTVDTCMTGATPTAEVGRWLSAAQIEEVKPVVEKPWCTNCGQWQHSGDCMNRCVERGLAKRMRIGGQS